mmetsp:Transcript_15912/g.28542  ORF Transcript_15912/g.28542 Transcript_15912/m.28542 type:complete len:474 (+) Transcript_15912:186-1607(+)
MLKNVKNFKRFRGGKSKIKNQKMINSPVGSSICSLQPYDTVGGSGVKSPEETKEEASVLAVLGFLSFLFTYFYSSGCIHRPTFIYRCFLASCLSGLEKASRLYDLDFGELVSPLFVVLLVVDEPLVLGEILWRCVAKHVFHEGSSDLWRQKLTGFLDLTPIFDEVLREDSIFLSVGGVALHFGVNFPRDERSGVNPWVGVASAHLFLEHQVKAVESQLGHAIWAICWKSRAGTGNTREHHHTVLVLIGLAEERVESLSEEQRTVDVDVGNLEPLLLRQFHHLLAGGVDCRVVHKSAQGDVALGLQSLDALGDAVAAIVGCHVRDDWNDFALKCSGLVLGLLQGRLATADHHHRGATLCETKSSGLADTGSTSGDDVKLVLVDLAASSSGPLSGVAAESKNFESPSCPGCVAQDGPGVGRLHIRKGSSGLRSIGAHGRGESPVLYGGPGKCMPRGGGGKQEEGQHHARLALMLP